jgi:hypothetical protein
MIKVEGHAGLYKDPSKNTFINKNKVEIQAARERKQSRLQKNEEEQELRQKVDQLQDDISELKSMFQQLLEK